MEKEIPEWMRRFLQDVFDMREAQRDFFSGRTDYKLKVAKAKEAKVDAFLKKAVTAGAVIPKPPDSDQSNLFNQ